MENRILNRDEIIDMLLSSIETIITEIDTLETFIELLEVDRSEATLNHIKRYVTTMKVVADSNWKLFNSQLRIIDHYPID